MDRKKNEATGKMTKLCRKIVHVNIKWKILDKVSVFREFFRFIWDKLFICSIGKQPRSPNHHHRHYSRLGSTIQQAHITNNKYYSSTTTAPEILEIDGVDDQLIIEGCRALSRGSSHRSDHTTASDSDLVMLKVSLLGDCETGKTSFAAKYVGDEKEKSCIQMNGLNLMDKTLSVRGATIAFSLWDVGGDHKSSDHVPIACRDSVAILFMFDLTSRCTLNSVVSWYGQARKWNQTAIPILIGTKFDDFVRLPPDVQWTIVTQARAYARVMKGTLFFSSATHNINVNKIFKFIMAKLFNLPWTVERNLTIGEPIIDY